jgi:hypothetical protein
VAEEERGEKEVVQPVNPTANVAANAPVNPTANAPANTPANAAGNVVNNAANAANTQGNAVANLGQNAGAQPPPTQANRIEGSQRQRIRDEVDIERHANYDREQGVPDALDANNLAKQRTSDICMIKNSYDVPTMTKIMILLTTSTSSRQLTPRPQAKTCSSYPPP